MHRAWYRYSPLSSVIERRASDEATRKKRERAQHPPTKPPARAGPTVSPADGAHPVRHYTRIDSDTCVPLLVRTARFDIQPNRFGILGQFGPERKLQLVATNLSEIVGWDGRLVPNATVESRPRTWCTPTPCAFHSVHC